MEKSQVIARLAALAQETRLDILRHLVRHEPSGVASGGIGAALGLPSATLAFHLNAMVVSGLVRRRRAGRQVIYRADIEAVQALTRYLLDSCCAEGVGDAACQPGRASTQRRTDAA